MILLFTYPDLTGRQNAILQNSFSFAFSPAFPEPYIQYRL